MSLGRVRAGGATRLTPAPVRPEHPANLRQQADGRVITAYCVAGRVRTADFPLLERSASPVEGNDPARSVVRNGDFSADEDGDGAAAHRSVQTAAAGGGGVREQFGGGWAQHLTLPALDAEGKGSVTLAQHDVPVREGQWYRLALDARAEGLRGARISLTVTNTSTWRPFFAYQHLSPNEQWRHFTLPVQSSGSASTGMRPQLWYSAVGTVWVRNLRMIPCDPPTRWRWSSGPYLDEPTEMDDPYRFFRW